MPAWPRGFDRLSGLYRALEFLAFGRDLERARFRFLDQLRDCADILILGEGDGRCIERVARIAPAARIRCVDASAGMLARAGRRLGPGGGRALIRFEHADARAIVLPEQTYDAVLTLFFLDCFCVDDVAALVGRTQRSLRPGGLWVFADFALPTHGWSRLRARMWLAALYRFFRWQTGIDAKALPPSEDLLRDAGWQPVASHNLQGGFIRSVLFTRAPGVLRGQHLIWDGFAAHQKS